MKTTLNGILIAVKMHSSIHCQPRMLSLNLKQNEAIIVNRIDLGSNFVRISIFRINNCSRRLINIAFSYSWPNANYISCVVICYNPTIRGFDLCVQIFNRTHCSTGMPRIKLLNGRIWYY